MGVLHPNIYAGRDTLLETAGTLRFCLQSLVSLDISMSALEGSRDVKREMEPLGNPSRRAGAGAEHVLKLWGSQPIKLR